MRKIHLMLYALIMLNFACESIEDSNQMPGGNAADYQQITENFYQAFHSSIKDAGTSFTVKPMEQSTKKLVLVFEHQQIMNTTWQVFDRMFHPEMDMQSSINLWPYPAGNLTFEKAAMVLERLSIDSKAFNTSQKAYLIWLARGVANSNNYTEGFELVKTFQDQVSEAPDLTDSEKILLLEIAAGSRALLELFQDGAIEDMRDKLTTSLDSTGWNNKTTQCNVEWRKIWISGVVSFTAGAVSGAIAGATVGTVTIPLLGTATGAVGGAVFGGAAGFTSGVLYGIATDLIASCFRSDDPQLQQTFSSCENAWEAYILNQTNEIPSECLVVEVLL
jgi:uncharacterized membrane protein